MTKKKTSWLDKNQNQIINILIIATIIWVMVAPILLARGIDFTNTGQIGDTLGGITMPAIGLLSAFLVYFSFKAQIKANKQINAQIKKEHEDTNFHFLIDEWKETCKELERVYGEGNALVLKDVSGFWDMANKMDRYRNENKNFDENEEKDATDCLRKMNILLSKIKYFNHYFNSTLNLDVDKKHKRVLYGKIEYYYENVLSEVCSWLAGLNVNGSYAEGSTERKILLAMREMGGYAKNIQEIMRGIKASLGVD